MTPFSKKVVNTFFNFNSCTHSSASAADVTTGLYFRVHNRHPLPLSLMNRQAFKAAKELEEARKAGTAPPEVDSDGKTINPHIPEYISRAPWYVAQDGPSLKHQRNHNETNRNYDPIDKWLPRAQFKGPAATKYRRGACKNCGALTHTEKECLERPRRRGAKLTGTDIRPDEVTDHVNFDFQGKRDRWNGYDINNFTNVHDRFAKLDAARKAVKAEKLDDALRQGKLPNEDNSDDDTGEIADGAVVQETGDAAKTAVRNLRIREDTAKYLYNLDLNSAYYDPKSRSMRADPHPDENPDDKDFLGDNFVRHSDEVKKLAQMNLFAIRATEAGRNLPHIQAEPSRAEAVFKEFESKKNALQQKTSANIIEKYGGQDHSRPDQAIDGVQQTEAYTEYNADGKVISRAKQVVPASSYAEDILEKNHTAIWGSYFKDGKWGYACCFQLQRYAFCTGEDGIKASVSTDKEMAKRTTEAEAKRDSKPLTQQWKELQNNARDSRANSSEVGRASKRPRHQDSEEAPAIYRLSGEDPMEKYMSENKDS